MVKWMKEDKHIKLCIIGLDICCLVMSIVLLVQTAVQRNQLQMMQQMKEQVKLTREEASDDLLQWEEKNRALTGTADQIVEDVQDFLREYDELRKEVSDTRQMSIQWQKVYDKRLYLDDLALEVDKEEQRQDYIERYFNLDKKKLQDVLDDTFWEDELGAKFDNMDKWGELLPVGEGIWNRYEVDSTRDSLPLGIVVQNPLIDFGYREARAGMNLLAIEDDYPEARELDKELADGNFRGLRFEDERYVYYYVTVGHDTNCTILYVTHRE